MSELVTFTLRVPGRETMHDLRGEVQGPHLDAVGYAAGDRRLIPDDVLGLPEGTDCSVVIDGSERRATVEQGALRLVDAS